MPGKEHNVFVVVRLGSLGDVVLTTGALQAWHVRTGAEFIFVTKQAFAPALENHPAIKEIITVPGKYLTTTGWLNFCRLLARRFKGLQLIDLHCSLRSRILRIMWPCRTYTYPKLALHRRMFGLTGMDLFRRGLLKSNIPQRYFRALYPGPPARYTLEPRVYLSTNEKTGAKKTLEQAGICLSSRHVPVKPLVALHPYATHRAKAWPTDNWLALATLLENRGMDWIIIGRENYSLLPDSSRDLTSRTDIRQTCALLEHCTALVTGDSGPMHLARAVQIPLVAMFGPTTREWGFFPAAKNSLVLEAKLPCRPCSLHGRLRKICTAPCMHHITPGQVLEALNKISGRLDMPSSTP
ncbi:glycosyltransferase family 9 protein [Desulfonatronospira sp.]|uniref:glycosyltransferase family 9 protein n=1 Tax=Desulfonatronospira sp. TaxID=1962951 RepID=UPI0025C3FA21|nr:glycosyltransferase family 9 protein [Desulfonatronospira sp.]